MESTLVQSIETLPTAIKPVSKVSETRDIRQAIKSLLLDHMVLIGLQYEIPKDKAERSAFIGRWHDTICENNTSWPIGFDNVAIYKAFLIALRDGRVELRKTSAFAHAMAFKDWVKSGNLNRFKPQHKALMAPQSQSMSLTEHVKNLRSTISFCQSNGYQLLPEDNIRRKSYENAIKELDAIQYQQGGVKDVI